MKLKGLKLTIELEELETDDLSVSNILERLTKLEFFQKNTDDFFIKSAEILKPKHALPKKGWRIKKIKRGTLIYLYYTRPSIRSTAFVEDWVEGIKFSEFFTDINEAAKVLEAEIRSNKENDTNYFIEEIE